VAALDLVTIPVKGLLFIAIYNDQRTDVSSMANCEADLQPITPARCDQCFAAAAIASRGISQYDRRERGLSILPFMARVPSSRKA